MKHIVTAVTGKIRRIFTANSKITTKLNRAPERGMWMAHNGRPCILTNIEAGDVCTVMYVDPEMGTNVLEAHVPGSELRQADYTEIPIARRPAEDVCAVLGYGRG